MTLPRSLLHENFKRGLDLFNRAHFFDAHEALEDVWRKAPASQKKLFQGLVQVALAFHHYSTGNRVGMKSVMGRAMRNMAEARETFSGIRVQPLLETLAAWREALDQGSPLPPLPRIEAPEKDG